MPKRYSGLGEYPQAYRLCRKTGNHAWDEKNGTLVTEVLSTYTSGITKQFLEILYCGKGCGTKRETTYLNVPKARRLQVIERKLKNPTDYAQPDDMKGVEAPREVWRYELSIGEYPGIRLE